MQQRFKAIAGGTLPMRQAGPTPILRPFDQPRPQRIALYVTQHSVKMIVFLNREGLETALIKVPGPGGVVVGVPALRMRMRQPAQERGQVVIASMP